MMYSFDNAQVLIFSRVRLENAYSRPKMWVLEDVFWELSHRDPQIHFLAYYQNYSIDSNQILHSDKDHQMPFVYGPNTRITNP